MGGEWSDVRRVIARRLWLRYHLDDDAVDAAAMINTPRIVHLGPLVAETHNKGASLVDVATIALMAAKPGYHTCHVTFTDGRTQSVTVRNGEMTAVLFALLKQARRTIGERN